MKIREVQVLLAPVDEIDDRADEAAMLFMDDKPPILLSCIIVNEGEWVWGFPTGKSLSNREVRQIAQKLPDNERPIHFDLDVLLFGKQGGLWKRVGRCCYITPVKIKVTPEQNIVFQAGEAKQMSVQEYELDLPGSVHLSRDAIRRYSQRSHEKVLL